jgi:hypothetical protein
VFCLAFIGCIVAVNVGRDFVLAQPIIGARMRMIAFYAALNEAAKATTMCGQSCCVRLICGLPLESWQAVRPAFRPKLKLVANAQNVPFYL